MKLVLTLLPDGRGIVTCDQDMTQSEARGLVEGFRAWRDTPAGMLIIANCRVEDRITSVDLELPIEVVPPAPDRGLQDQRIHAA